MIEARHESKKRLLDAALQVIRAKGYSATRIEDVCDAAGLTKGSFFHHFKGKEELAVTVAEYWSSITGALFEAAPYHQYSDPRDRVLGYIDFRRSILRGELHEFTCLVGTMVQETYNTHPSIRDACEKSICEHAAEVEKDIAKAKERYAPHAAWTAQGLALYTQAVLQGAFVLAKAKGGPQIAEECIDHLRRYLETLFNHKSAKEQS
jgi:TetR/AcrR family transcriptional repressor of nem operon